MSDEALRLLERLLEATSLESVNSARREARAFLAQPTAAREAALVEKARAYLERGLHLVGCNGLPHTKEPCDCGFQALKDALADPSPAAAALLARREPCGKCRLHGLVIAEAKRHLQSVLGWVPDNDARREAARFLRMSERQVRAALAPGEEPE